MSRPDKSRLDGIAGRRERPSLRVYDLMAIAKRPARTTEGVYDTATPSVNGLNYGRVYHPSERGTTSGRCAEGLSVITMGSDPVIDRDAGLTDATPSRDGVARA